MKCVYFSYEKPKSAPCTPPIARLTYDRFRFIYLSHPLRIKFVFVYLLFCISFSGSSTLQRTHHFSIRVSKTQPLIDGAVKNPEHCVTFGKRKICLRRVAEKFIEEARADAKGSFAIW